MFLILPIVCASEGMGQRRNWTPSNRFTSPREDKNHTNPSEVCVIVYIPLGADPSCVRQEVCMYWVTCLLGSRAWSVLASNKTQTTQELRRASIAPMAASKRSRNRRGARFPMFVAELRQRIGRLELIRLLCPLMYHSRYRLSVIPARVLVELASSLAPFLLSAAYRSR